MAGQKSGKKSGARSGKKSPRSTKAKKPGKRSKKSAKSSKSEPHDLLHPAVAENLYFIAHDAPEALTKRGFGWPDAPKRKKKGARKGRKKK